MFALRAATPAIVEAWHRCHTPDYGLAMTPRSLPPFRADHVGSFLRPKALLDARGRHKNGKIDRAELRKVEDEAIRDIVRFQEELGLHGITDGEFRRTYFHIDFLEQLEGVETKGGIAVSFHSNDGNIDKLVDALATNEYLRGRAKNPSRPVSKGTFSKNQQNGRYSGSIEILFGEDR